MKLLDYLRSQRTVQVAVKLQFQLAYKPGTKDLYAFFEGKTDYSFYLPELRRRWRDSSDLHYFQCDGKQGVLTALSDVLSTIDRANRSMFFIDKDLDDIIPKPLAQHPSLFVTDCYSFENYLVSSDAVIAAWTDLFHLDAKDERLPTVLKAFNDGHMSFVNAITPLMTLILAEYRTGEKPILAEITLDRILHVTDDLTVKRKNGILDYLRTSCGFTAGPIQLRAMRQVYKEIKTLHPSRYIRGKFDLWYLVVFLKRIAEAVASKGPNRALIHTQINLSNAVDLLAARIPCPAVLSSFLNQFPQHS